MPQREFILGGQRSGKSRAAELRAQAWLAQPGHTAVLIATAVGGDAEMRERIERHQQDRAQRVPGLTAHELHEPHSAERQPALAALAGALRQHSAPHCLVVVDCLTLWLTQLLMPQHGPAVAEHALAREVDALCAALQTSSGPVVCVSNEIGLGLVPLSPELRRFVDELGRLHQRVAAVCERVTLMVAGLPLVVKPVGGHGA